LEGVLLSLGKLWKDFRIYANSDISPYGCGSFSHSYTIISTGGTAVSLENVGISVKKVEEITAFPEMVREKTIKKL
jgi:AICAR transformylase/IMP cyclohydrolase PurH